MSFFGFFCEGEFKLWWRHIDGGVWLGAWEGFVALIVLSFDSCMWVDGGIQIKW
jgi:hypothetical protein